MAARSCSNPRRAAARPSPAISTTAPNLYCCARPANSLSARHALGRRILEMQRLAGAEQRMDRVRRERRLGEAREDELELPRIGGDVADREDAADRAHAGRGIDGDLVPLEREAPSRDRPEILRQAEKSEQRVARQPPRP